MSPTPSPVTEGEERSPNADVTYVRATQSGDGSWTFQVTVEHPDTGWEDYADGWDVVLPDGAAIKPDPDSPFTRLLLHPHETEQPFTRSQSGIVIPDGITQVTVRAHDLVDGFGGREVPVDLTVDPTLDADGISGVYLRKGLEPIPNVRGLGEMDDRLEVEAIEVEISVEGESTPRRFARRGPIWLGLVCGLFLEIPSIDEAT